MNMSSDNNSGNVHRLPDETTVFPDGLRVLAVDGNAVCLKLLVRLLEICRYKVTATKNPLEALEKLRGNKGDFDLVITDVNNIDMNGFSLLDIVVFETDLPVIMTSADDSRTTVMEGIRHGARDYLLKPIRLAVIKNIWQHVVRKSLADEVNDLKEDIGQSLNNTMKSEGHVGNHSQNEVDEQPSCSVSKRSKRLVWDRRLHNKFLDALEILGKNAVPKQILLHMNEPGLTRANVASHLQKYRNMINNPDSKANNREVSNNTISNLWPNSHIKFGGYQIGGASTLNHQQQMGLIPGMQNRIQGDQFYKAPTSLDHQADHIHKSNQSTFHLQQPNRPSFYPPQFSPRPPPLPQFVDQMTQQRMHMYNRYQNMRGQYNGMEYIDSFSGLGSQFGQSSMPHYPQVPHPMAYPGPGPSSLLDIKNHMVENDVSNSATDANFSLQNFVSVPTQSCMIGNNFEGTNMFEFDRYSSLDISIQNDHQEINTESSFPIITLSPSEEHLSASLNEFINEGDQTLASLNLPYHWADPIV